MIRINKNQNNLITVTLEEKRTLENAVYLFKFTNDITKQSVKFIAQNISEYTYRYDQFLITETTGANNLTSGVITLSPTGFWSYTIYEQVSNTNLNESLSGNIVETGKVHVIGDASQYPAFDNSKTFISYGTGA